MSEESSRELRKIAEGREAEMFAWDEGKVLRLLRNPRGQRQLQWEAAAMETARSRGISVPAVYGLTTALGRPGMVMERLEGPDLLTLVGRQPWAVFRIAQIGGQVHAQLHEVRAPSAIPPTKESLKQGIIASGKLPARLVEFALGVLAGLPEGDRLCHGDFHPGNILMAGEEPVLIDWTNARRGDPMADVARTRMMLRLGEPPPGTSFAVRMMALVGRNLLVALYLRSYRKARPLDMDAVKRWEIPMAAARLSEGIEEEVPRLLALLEGAVSKVDRG